MCAHTERGEDCWREKNTGRRGRSERLVPSFKRHTWCVQEAPVGPDAARSQNLPFPPSLPLRNRVRPWRRLLFRCVARCDQVPQNGINPSGVLRDDQNRQSECAATIARADCSHFFFQFFLPFYVPFFCVCARVAPPPRWTRSVLRLTRNATRDINLLNIIIAAFLTLP